MQPAQDSDNTIITTKKSSALSAAERMANTRLRRKYGFCCYTIELHKDEVTALIQMGLLRSEERENKDAVVAALSVFFDRTLNPASSVAQSVSA